MNNENIKVEVHQRSSTNRGVRGFNFIFRDDDDVLVAACSVCVCSEKYGLPGEDDIVMFSREIGLDSNRLVNLLQHSQSSYIAVLNALAVKPSMRLDGLGRYILEFCLCYIGIKFKNSNSSVISKSEAINSDKDLLKHFFVNIGDLDLLTPKGAEVFSDEVYLFLQMLDFGACEQIGEDWLILNSSISQYVSRAKVAARLHCH
jgi:hypothetical protein